ncbi:MAG TPA: hypothetical protein PLD20_14295 [Blastocatellia bacterium]|nr:hypothetical protein [Blastocatellia bacterium]HMV84331.1 hypothetical protein [Blastocatellia bacterium]HMY74069.1 hypothetical protein [Blastocatellia bacterium]HMZ19103.1 hypothetical protein [Blastocatellia bacterium]HNG30680.1 hypothetical protein [Blastocatellia bacterium]
MQFAASFDSLPHDKNNPDPWLALYLDRSIRLDEEAKAAMLLSMRSRSRQFLLPLLRPLARLAMMVIQVVKTTIPNRFTSSPLLHRLIYWGLKYFVSPEANFLIVRHFHLGSEILAFIAANANQIKLDLHTLRPKRLEDLLDDTFLKHDLNLFNFVIQLNQQLREQNRELEPPAQLNFDAITDGPFPLETFPQRWTNVIDVQTAIELYTPLYQLFLTDDDFWRAANSLQLDETVGVYVARLLNNPHNLGLINNKHPMVPLSTLGSGFRLLLHGLAAETLHALLREFKRKQVESSLVSMAENQGFKQQ